MKVVNKLISRKCIMLCDVKPKQMFAMLPYVNGSTSNVCVKLSNNVVLNLATGYTLSCADPTKLVLPLDAKVSIGQKTVIKPYTEVKNGEVILLDVVVPYKKEPVMKYDDTWLYIFRTGCFVRYVLHPSCEVPVIKQATITIKYADGSIEC